MARMPRLPTPMPPCEEVNEKTGVAYVTLKVVHKCAGMVPECSQIDFGSTKHLLTKILDKSRMCVYIANHGRCFGKLWFDFVIG